MYSHFLRNRGLCGGQTYCVVILVLIAMRSIAVEIYGAESSDAPSYKIYGARGQASPSSGISC